MRVYLPATLGTLAEAYVAGGFEPGYAAHAVTPAVREWYVEGDEEELEYAALSAAAEASLDLLRSELAAQARFEHRRVVVAADLDDQAVTPDASRGVRSAVTLGTRVTIALIASVHVDEDADEARQVVADAIASLPLAATDADAAFAVDEARALDLLWYDVREIPDLI